MEILFRDYVISPLDTTKPEKTFKLINENRSRLENYFAGTVKKTTTLKDTEIFCEEIKQKRDHKEYFPFSISDHRTSKYIGWIDVKNIDWEIPKAELGYFLDHSYTGKGIISEGLSLLIGHINELYGFKKLLLRIGSDNPKSTKIALNNDFELEGTIRRDYKTTDGNIVDLQYFGRLF